MGAVAVAATLILLTAGCGATPVVTAPSVSATPTQAPTPAAQVPIVAATPAPARTPTPPTRVVIPAIAVDVPVIEVGVDAAGAMELPTDPAIGGWYRYSADAAAQEGRMVISSHVDAPGYPIGPFSRIRELAPGTHVDVTDAAGEVHGYTITRVDQYPKATLPTDDLFARTGPRELVLITCGGAFDASTGHYVDNVVAIASPIK